MQERGNPIGDPLELPALPTDPGVEGLQFDPQFMYNVFLISLVHNGMQNARIPNVNEHLSLYGQDKVDLQWTGALMILGVDKSDRVSRNFVKLSLAAMGWNRILVLISVYDRNALGGRWEQSDPIMEIEQVMEFDLDRLLQNINPFTRLDPWSSFFGGPIPFLYLHAVPDQTQTTKAGTHLISMMILEAISPASSETMDEFTLVISLYGTPTNLEPSRLCQSIGNPSSGRVSNATDSSSTRWEFLLQVLNANWFGQDPTSEVLEEVVEFKDPSPKPLDPDSSEDSFQYY